MSCVELTLSLTLYHSCLLGQNILGSCSTDENLFGLLGPPSRISLHTMLLAPRFNSCPLESNTTVLVSDRTSVSPQLRDLGLRGLPPRGQLVPGLLGCSLQMTVQLLGHD